MRHLKIRKDMDDYLSKRTKQPKEKKSWKDIFVRREFKEHHVTINDHQLEDLQSSNDVVIIKDDPDFFSVLHDKIIKFFKKKD